MKISSSTVIIGLIFLAFKSHGQHCYWQQAIDYTIRVKLDTAFHKLIGTEDILYTNHSPDTLTKVYFHLYYNAFQPNSAMDIRSRTIADPDKRVGQRIYNLKEDEIGKYSIKSIKQNNKSVKSFQIFETLMEVELAKPLLPGTVASISLDFEAQIPIQIRRTGRNNMEQVAYSMSQWYPKVCEYDRDGWALNPYIGREFYGVWGNFNVYITAPESYKIAGTGNKVSKIEVPVLKGKSFSNKEKFVTHYFKAENVHDFVWAADPDYIIDQYKVNDKLTLEFAYKKTVKSTDDWKKLQPIMAEAISFASKTFGDYPYRKYSFIQGGDGGMEYPMATLIVGNIPLTGLISVSVHEMMHSWYQGVLGFNESLYPWMDEGFTSYAETLVKEHLKSKGLYPGEVTPFPFLEDRNQLINFTKSGKSEPLSLHADHYHTNTAYSIGSYVKGAIYLDQLGYVIGDQKLSSILKEFYQIWKFKHPTNKDFNRLVEKRTGMQLDWYDQYMINWNALPDYSIDTLYAHGKLTNIVLSNHGTFPMPIDVVVEKNDGSKAYYTIPLDIMMGSKDKDKDQNWMTLKSWKWVMPTYEWSLNEPFQNIKQVSIDPSMRMADMNDKDNVWKRE